MIQETQRAPAVGLPHWLRAASRGWGHAFFSPCSCPAATHRTCCRAASRGLGRRGRSGCRRRRCRGGDCPPCPLPTGKDSSIHSFSGQRRGCGGASRRRRSYPRRQRRHSSDSIGGIYSGCAIPPLSGLLDCQTAVAGGEPGRKHLQGNAQGDGTMATFSAQPIVLTPSQSHRSQHESAWRRAGGRKRLQARMLVRSSPAWPCLSSR